MNRTISDEVMIEDNFAVTQGVAVYGVGSKAATVGDDVRNQSN
jgi:hypothetical protein